MKVLVLSHQHGLAPLAWRLKREGADVQFCVWSQKYEPTWGGRLVKSPTGKPNEKAAQLGELVQPAIDGELVVVTDSDRGMELFGGAKHLYGIVDSHQWPHLPALCVVGWFDGESWSGRRWCVPDWGLWPGGLGAQVMGGCTLIAGDTFPPVMEVFTDGLKGLGFKGLVTVGLDYLEAGRELVPTGFVAGWPSLVTTAWMSECTNLSTVLDGTTPPNLTDKPFVVALPVSMPPYPVRGAPGPSSVPLAGLTKDITQYCYFHDMEVKGNDVWTAGLNGLVAVVAAPGHSMYTAHRRALGAAVSLPLPDKQFRPDVGERVNMVLSSLEQLNYI